MPPADRHPGQGGHRGRGVGHDEGAGRQAARGDGAARVETEPAEPEQAGTEDRHGRVVWLDLLLAEAQPPPQDERGHQGRDAGTDMDHGPTGEVQCSEVV